jgi:iron(III) transport system substrate-binding protein
MKLRITLVFLAMALVVGVPFLLRPEQNLLAAADDTLVIVSPHNEAIRYEFTRAFTDWYAEQTGRTVRIDWRIVGGTTEIARFLQSEFFTVFQREWTRAGHRWTPEVQAAFDNPAIEPATDAEGMDDPARAARRAFLESTQGIGVDLFFGGGEFDFNRQARAGRIVPSRILQTHPQWFQPDSIPQKVSGEIFYDLEGRWIGTCLSAFGIVYNVDSLERLGFRAVPDSWIDLTLPIAYRQVALADPTKSGSAAKAFEMIIQQQMQEAVDELGLEEGLREGWKRGLQIILRASANARYFTDAATKVPMDIALGDAALGMSIDFYGRFASEAVAQPDGTSRVQYVTPVGGSSVGVDPIALIRGGPAPEVAERFIEFVLSLEGQKLWDFRVGTPGGPIRYALRRPPIRKELYLPEWNHFRSDPDVDPYREAESFFYHAEWTAPLFRAMTFIIRVSCLDTHHEQVQAWGELIRRGLPEDAVAVFENLDLVDYETARDEISPILRSADRIQEVQLAARLGDHFRAQYREAARLARQHPEVHYPRSPADAPENQPATP